MEVRTNRACSDAGTSSWTTGNIVVRAGDDEIMLSRREFDILGVLLSRRGEAVSKEELMDRIWGPEFNGDPNILEVYVSYLRKKIDAPFDRRSLETVRGFGYRLIDEHRK